MTTERTLPYTVVGVHPDDFDQMGEDATYCEWVEATDPEAAAYKARSMYPDRAGSIIVAVFEGHIVDKLFDKGLASDPRAEHDDDCATRCPVPESEKCRIGHGCNYCASLEEEEAGAGE